MRAGVDYLAWAKRARAMEPRISLLDSGLYTPFSRLPVPPDSLLKDHPPGSSAVREGVSRRYGLPPEEVFPVLGTSLGLFLAAAAVLDPGDHVLAETPGYESLRRVPEVLGARVDLLPRREESGWALDPETVLRAWTDETRLLLVSDLHNPTGRRAGDDALAGLAREADRRGAYLLVDEVYRDFRSGPPGTARRLGGNVITVSSLTKVYGLGGLRAGWVAGPPGIVARMSRVQDLLHSVDPTPGEPLVAAAFAEADRLRAEALETAAAGWSVVRSWGGEQHGLRVTSPHGGIHAWIRLPPGTTGTEVADALLHQEGVALVPGRFFGDDSGVRVGFSAEPRVLTEGLEALARTVSSRP